LAVKSQVEIKPKHIGQSGAVIYSLTVTKTEGVEGQVWYRGWEVPRMLLLGFYLREAFQSQNNTEKILYNKSR